MSFFPLHNYLQSPGERILATSLSFTFLRCMQKIYLLHPFSSKHHFEYYIRIFSSIGSNYRYLSDVSACKRSRSISLTRRRVRELLILTKINENRWLLVVINFWNVILSQKRSLTISFALKKQSERLAYFTRLFFQHHPAIRYLRKVSKWYKSDILDRDYSNYNSNYEKKKSSNHIKYCETDIWLLGTPFAMLKFIQLL